MYLMVLGAWAKVLYFFFRPGVLFYLMYNLSTSHSQAQSSKHNNDLC